MRNFIARVFMVALALIATSAQAQDEANGARCFPRVKFDDPQLAQLCAKRTRENECRADSERCAWGQAQRSGSVTTCISREDENEIWCQRFSATTCPPDQCKVKRIDFYKPVAPPDDDAKPASLPAARDSGRSEP